jgi:DNA repair protein RadD
LILRPYQQAAVDAVYRHLRDHDDNPVVVLPTGCHAEGHPILMFDGTVRPVEQVQVGDYLMGPDSRPRRVLGLCRGEDDLFRVVPHRGEPFVVNGDHVLSLVRTNESRNPDRNPFGGEVEDVVLREYLAKPRWWRHVRKLYRVPVAFSAPRDLPLPPYILGLLLGDGCLRGGIVELTTADDTLAEVWLDYATAIGCDTTVRANGRCPTYRLRRRCGRYNLVTEALEILGLAECSSATKFIPHAYLTAGRADRLQLLAGLIDTDGYPHRSGFEIATQSRELAADLLFLARSLGFAASCRSKWATCQTGAGGWFFRIHIDGDATEVPCRLERKKPTIRRQKKSVLRTGFVVEPCGRGRFFGFTLDGDHRYIDGHFIVHHNSGKTPVMATICRDAVQTWNGRVLVLAHVKELLQQSVDKLKQVCPDLKVGVYSAGLKRRDTEHAVIVAGIQSVYQRAEELGAFDLILVDECHLIPADGEGMYRQFLAEAKSLCPHLRVIGFTATPFRLDAGPICRENHFLNAVCFEVGIRELIRDGYLSKLVSKAGIVRADTSQLHVRAGEFVASEVEAVMDEAALVEAACAEIVELTKDRHAVLIFAAGVQHGRHVCQVLAEKHGVECGFVCGETPDGERDALLRRFRGESTGLFQQHPLKYLCNVNVLTTGFDAPNVDCVVLLRPTMSPGLYYQMVGRGFRMHPGKTDCLVLDYGGNVLRHGPVDQVRAQHGAARGTGEAPAKECPDCRALIAAAYRVCPDCGHEFPKPETKKHDDRAASHGVLSGEVIDQEWEVRDVIYSVHTKKDAPDHAPKTMRVDYRLGLDHWVSEWVCFEHSGWARRKAAQRGCSGVGGVHHGAVRRRREVRPDHRLQARPDAGAKPALE